MTPQLAPLLLSLLASSLAAQGGTVARLGLATPGSAGFPRLLLTGGPFVGQRMWFEVDRARASASGFVLAGPDGPPRSLGAYGALFYPGTPLERVPFQTDAFGASGRVGRILPLDPHLLGIVFVAQAVVQDPVAQGGWAFTRALRFVIGVTPTGPIHGARALATDGTPRDLVVGDVDDDGLPDLVVAAARVQLFEGRGDGRFANAQTVSGLSERSYSIAIGDLDGDSALDLVVGTLGEVVILGGSGDGTFVRAGNVLVPQAEELELADLDGDGVLDLIVSNATSGNLDVWLGLGTGRFTRLGAIDTFGDPHGLEIGDVDRDGALDLLVLEEGSPEQLALRFGAGDGTFGAPLAFPLGAGDEPEDHLLVDVDGDGLLDLAAARTASDDLWVRLGNGDGSFRPELTTAVGAVEGIGIDDLDLDGRPDLVTIARDGLRVAPGLGDGTFGATTRHVQGISGSDLDLWMLGDLSQDGHPDPLAIARLSSTAVAVYLSDADGLPLGALQTEVTGTSLFGVGAVAVEDLDGDQVPDVALHDRDGFTILRGTGGGGLEELGTTAVRAEVTDLVLGDFDGDGILDVAVSSLGDRTVEVHLGLGDGSFALAGALPTTSEPRALAAGDFDGDGRDDVAVLRGPLSAVLVLYGSDVGGLAPGVGFPAGDRGIDLAAADLDHDGLCDLVIADERGRALLGRLSLGHGAFSPEIRTPLAGNPLGLVLFDADVDGELDVAALSEEGGTQGDMVRFLLGDGTGSFAGVSSVPADIQSFGRTRLTVGDVNADAAPDVVVVASWAENAVLHLGEADGEFLAGVPFLANTVTALTIADVTDDGLPDLVFGSAAGVAVYPNSTPARSAQAAAAAGKAVPTGTVPLTARR